MKTTKATVCVSLVYKGTQYNCGDKIVLPTDVYDEWLAIDYCKPLGKAEEALAKSEEEAAKAAAKAEKEAAKADKEAAKAEAKAEKEAAKAEAKAEKESADKNK